MLKIHLFHSRKPKNKLSSKPASSPNVLTLVLSWKSSSVPECPLTLAVPVHPPGAGAAPAKRREVQGKREVCTTTIRGYKYTIAAVVLIASLRCTCTFCRAAAEACVGTQRIPVSKGFGCSHHRLPSKAHSGSSDLPRCRNGACDKAGNEPKSGPSPALELVFAMLPLNTKLASLGNVSLQDFQFI